MGLLSQILQKVSGGALSSEHHNALLDTVIGMLTNPDSGGLPGLLQTLKDKGLGDAVSSWVGTGHNIPVSASQITQAIGPERIQAIAAEIGVDPARVSDGLSKLLPKIIDRLTPGGQVPTETPTPDAVKSVKNLFGL